MSAPKPPGGMVKEHVAKLLKRMGYEIRRTRGSARLHLDGIRDQRWLVPKSNPLILDVGANRGQSARRYLEVFPGAEIYAFEPGEAAYLELREMATSNPRIHPVRQVLADSVREVTFHLNRADFTSSLLPAASGSEAVVDQNLLSEVRQERLRAATLTEFCREQSISRVDVLKLDVQGAELLVLKGADTLLSGGAISIVFTEVQFAPLYDGQCFFGEVAEFLRQRSYTLFGLYDLHYGLNGVLAWGDALFVSQPTFASLATSVIATPANSFS